MKRGQNRCYMIIFSSFCQDSGSSILDKLQTSNSIVWKTREKYITIIKSGRYKCMDQS
ncbi:hypothetical protein LDENG_00256510, partial [Lucifuga dentata]